MTENEFIQRLQRAGKADETLALIDKLGFKRDFVLTNVLVDSGSVSVAHIAMLWQGMPNKHDRKRTQELLEALTEAGLLAFDQSTETWSLKM